MKTLESSLYYRKQLFKLEKIKRAHPENPFFFREQNPKKILIFSQNGKLKLPKNSLYFMKQKLEGNSKAWKLKLFYTFSYNYNITVFLILWYFFYTQQDFFSIFWEIFVMFTTILFLFFFFFFRKMISFTSFLSQSFFIVLIIFSL